MRYRSLHSKLPFRTEPADTGPANTGRAMHRGRRIGAALAAGALVLALAAGCTQASESTTASSASSSQGAPAEPAAPGQTPAAAGTSAAAGSSGAPAGAGSLASGAPDKAAGGKLPDIGAGVQAADRQVIRTATVTLKIAVKSTNTTAEADQAAEQAAVNNAFVRVSALASGAGYVSAADGQGTTMSVTLRVPAAGYTAAMTALQSIAPIISRQESTQDVTSQLIDIGSRMETMTASVNRVRALLSKADKIGDVISIESELTSREADLESLQRQQASLAGQTALSTITVVLQGAITGIKDVIAPVPPAARSGFLGGLANGWDAVRKIGHAGLTVVGTLIPFLPAVAVVIIAVMIWRRRVRPVVGPTPAITPGDPHPAD